MASPLPPIPENVEDLVGPPDIVVELPSEPVCPTIPGVAFPTLPDPEAFGKLIGEKLDSAADAVSESFEDLQKKAAALEERIKNPPSATDMINEMSTQVSSAADKAAQALEKGLIDAAAQVEENLVAEWDKAVEFARNSGTALADIYAGFKNAAECLKGAPGGAEEAFNKTAPELDAGVGDGRGQDGATAALAITDKTKVVVNESGQTVRQQDSLTAEKQKELTAEKKKTNEALAKKTGKPEKPITAKPVPVPDIPLVSEKEEKEYDEYMKAVGVTISSSEFRTVRGRSLTADEEARYSAGLPPINVSALPYYDELSNIRIPAWEPWSLENVQKGFDDYWLRIMAAGVSVKGSASAERKRQDIQRQAESWYWLQGKTIPANARVPYTTNLHPALGWTNPGKWHPGSYSPQQGPPPPVQKDITGPIMDTLGTLYKYVPNPADPQRLPPLVIKA